MSPRRREPDRWPWPADTPLDRARRIARSYRDALLAREPEACQQLDARSKELGQGWIVPKMLVYQDNDLLTTEEVADFCDAKPRTVDQWRARGLRAISTPDGLRYRMGDVLDYHAAKRRRRVEPGGTR